MRARTHYFADDPGPKPLSNDPVGRQHRIPRTEDEVCMILSPEGILTAFGGKINPRRMVKWNPYNSVYQCHACGHILYDEEHE